MARGKTAEAPSGSTRRILDVGKPTQFMTRSGAGRSRKPTEFDDLIPELHELNAYRKIAAEGDNEEALAEDTQNIYKEIAKAAAHHQLGVTRVLETPDKPGFESYGVHVWVHERQKRGPKKGSLRDPDTGKQVSPDDETGRYQELLEMRERDQ